MKPVVYYTGLDYWSKNGNTNCHRAYTEEYILCTSDKQLSRKIGAWKGIRILEGGHCPYHVLLIPERLIDRAIKLVNLPSRITVGNRAYDMIPKNLLKKLGLD